MTIRRAARAAAASLASTWRKSSKSAEAPEVADDLAERRLEPGDALVHPLKVGAKLLAVGVALVGGESLRRVREQELVSTFDGVDSLLERLQRAARSSCGAYFVAAQRSGSWCSRYWRRVMVPKIIDLVIQNFSGRSAK